MKRKNIVLAIMLLLFGSMAFCAGPIDSAIENIIRKSIREKILQNFENEKNGNSSYNSYIVNVVLGLPPTPGTGLMRQVNPKDVNGYAYGTSGLTDVEINDFDTKLKQINDGEILGKVVNGTAVKIKGMQYYLILINGLPVGFETEVPQHELISSILINKREVLDDVVLTSVKKGVAKEPYGKLKALTSATDELSRIISTEIDKIYCHWYSQNPGMSSQSIIYNPVFAINFVDYLLFWDYKPNPAGGATPYHGKSEEYLFLLYQAWANNQKCSITGQENYIEEQTANLSQGFTQYFNRKKEWKAPQPNANNRLDMKPSIEELIDWLKVTKQQYGLMYKYSDPLYIDDKINKTYACIQGLNAALSPAYECFDCGVTTPAEEPHGTTLFCDLKNMEQESYANLSTQQKFKIIKCLTAGNDNDYKNNTSNLLCGSFTETEISTILTKILLSVKDQSEANAFISFLQTQTNEIAKTNPNYKILARMDKMIMNDQLSSSGVVNGQMYMYQYHNAIVRIFILANPQLQNENTYANATEADFEKKLMIYDPYFSRFGTTDAPASQGLNFEMYQVGVTKYFTGTSFNNNTAQITTTKKTLDHYDIGNGFGYINAIARPDQYNPLAPRNTIKIYNSRGVFTEETQTYNAFDIIYLYAKTSFKSNLVANFASQQATSKLFAAPAYFLKYPGEISHSIEVAKFWEGVELSVGLAMDAAAFFLPEIKIVRLERLGNLGNAIIKRSVQAYKLMVQAGAVIDGSCRTLLLTQVGNGDVKFLKTMESYNAIVGLGYLGLDGLNGFITRRLVAGEAGVFRTSVGNFVQELHNPAVYDDLVNLGQNTATANGKIAAAMIDVARSLEAIGVDIYGFEKGWAFENASIAAMGESYNGVYRTGFFIPEQVMTALATQKTGWQLLAKPLGEVVAFAEYETPQVLNIVKNSTVIPDWADRFRLVKNINVKLPGAASVLTETNIVIGKGTGGACILAGKCFTGNTLVATAKGAVPFENLHNGDTVLSYNAVTKQNVWQRIGRVTKQTVQKLVKVFAGGQSIMATPEHPFYENRQGWVMAGNLKKGMQFLLASGMLLSVDSTATIDTTATVYNCDVPATNTYYVGSRQVLAHNANICSELTVGIMNKLGKGYDEVQAAIESLQSKYVLQRFSANATLMQQEEAIAELTALCSREINDIQLKNFFKALKENAVMEGKFLDDIKRDFHLLDDFAADGRALEAYTKYRTNPGLFAELLAESEQLGGSIHKFFKNRIFVNQVRAEARAFEAVATNYLKTIAPSVASQVHLDVEYLNAAGVLVKERVILDGLYKDISGKWIFTDAKYTTVNEFITKADYLSSCTPNQKAFYEALLNNKVQRIVSRSQNALTTLGINPGAAFTLSNTEFRILPSLKGLKQVDVSKIKNIFQL
jgi:Pretoxin HINT domain